MLGISDEISSLKHMGLMSVFDPIDRNFLVACLSLSDILTSHGRQGDGGQVVLAD